MRSYTEHKVIIESKFDDFELLLKNYYALLFYTISKEGIVYSTGRNGCLAKIVVESDGFINYVQPCIGKWNFDNPKYQRRVSLDFVLCLFNDQTMEDCFYYLNSLALPRGLEISEYSKSDIDLEDFDPSKIMDAYCSLMREKAKDLLGQKNNYDAYSQQEKNEIMLLYALVEKITMYSKDFALVVANKQRAKQMQADIENKRISYDDLSEDQIDFMEHYDYGYDVDNYLTLAALGRFVRRKASEQVYKDKKLYDKQRLNGIDEVTLASRGLFDNPVSITGFDEEDLFANPFVVVDMDDCQDEIGAVSIDYSNAKEFAKNLTLERK